MGTPFNISVNANHTQNTNTEMMNLSLPTLALNMNRIYPFAPKVGARKNALQNIGLTYTMNFENRYNVAEKDFMSDKMYRDAKTGLKQDVRMGTNLKLFKYFTVNPSISFSEKSTFKYIKKRYDPKKRNITIDTINNFNSFREYSGGASISTVIYGMKTFSKGKLKAIRHVITPSVSWNYRPDFSFYQKEIFNPSTGYTNKYTEFDQSVFGAPSSGGLSNSLSISINNNFEAKIAQKDENGKPIKDKKIKLLNNLSISTSYNIAADSLHWSPVNLNTGTSLFKNRLSINGSMNFDPYQKDSNGNRTKHLLLLKKQGFLRMTNANIASSFSISDEDFKKKQKNKKQKNKEKNDAVMRNPLTEDFGGIQRNQMRTNSKDQTQNKNDNPKNKPFFAQIKWRLNFQHSMSYSNRGAKGEITNNSLSMSGNISFSPKWKMNISSGYDFKNEGFTYTRLMISRDLKSWHTNFSWTPFGPRTSYNFFIGVKSSILSDLKWEKQKVPDRRLF